MTVSRAAAETLSQLRLRVRRKLGDPSANANGIAIPEEMRRWTDNAVDEAINDHLVDMGNDLSIIDMGEALIWTNITYAESADSDGYALPVGIAGDGIFKVEDRTDEAPVKLDYVSALEIEDFVSTNDSTATVAAQRRYTLVADPDSATAYRIIIRPSASGRTFRIHHVAAPLVLNASGDSIFLSSRWREYIAVGAAIKLLAIDDEVPQQLAAAFNALDSRYRSFCNRSKGPQRVRLVRRRTT